MIASCCTLTLSPADTPFTFGKAGLDDVAILDGFDSPVFFYTLRRKAKIDQASRCSTRLFSPVLFTLWYLYLVLDFRAQDRLASG